MADLPPPSQPATLIVTDLDGTLWDQHQWIHPATAAAMAEIELRNIPILLATGRRLASAKSGFALNNLWKPSILLNGTLGVNFPAGDVFHTATFTAADAEVVLDAFAEHGHVPCAYATDGLVYVGPDGTTSKGHHRALLGDIASTDHSSVVAAGQVLGFSVNGVQLEGLKGLAPRLRQHGMFVDHYRDPLYGGWSVMAQPPGISKLTGIAAFIAHAGLGSPKVIALGDGGNDVEMLAGADIGFAVDDGDPAAIAAADRTIAPPSQGGWAKVLEELS
jgi:hydroxymethylpyrimidine pyrophosphatase-like HAD family hydrolase